MRLADHLVQITGGDAIPRIADEARLEVAGIFRALAEEIARTDRFALKLMKESINAAQDAMGRRDAMKTAFANHQIGHLQNMLVHGFPIDITRLPDSVRLRLEEALAARRKG